MSLKINRILIMAVAVIVIAIGLTGCKKEEEPQGPVDEQLTAVTVDQLQPGCFYVKSNGQFYRMPAEDCNFDPEKSKLKSTDNTANGIMKDTSRLLSFTWRDNAIPTLYKNDQLIYVSTDNVPMFTWERYNDVGYSIGISGLDVNSSGKIASNEKTTKFANQSSAETLLTAASINAETGFTVDAINGTTLDAAFLADAKVITGMSKDATANVDIFVGTQHNPISMTADTRYFQTFEAYETSKYTLSTDGYAIVDVPTYFKSGYYLLNNAGFVKFLNVDRGVDESSIDLTTPYYYLDEDGKTLTYYEWADKNGIMTSVGEAEAVELKNAVNPDAFLDKMILNIDSMQETLNVNVAYKYNDEASEAEAANIGKFPHAYVIGVDGSITSIDVDESSTYSNKNKDGLTYLKASVSPVTPGTWYIVFNNFENISKTVATDLLSGNATTYVHNKDNGKISIYYNASDKPHDFIITWEQADRRATEVEVKAPSGEVFSADETPGNIMLDEAGKYEIKVPYLESGKYTFSIKGDALGRVWINDKESVGLYVDPETMEEPETDIEESSETEAAEEAGEAEESTEKAEN